MWGLLHSSVQALTRLVFVLSEHSACDQGEVCALEGASCQLVLQSRIGSATMAALRFLINMAT